MCSAARVIYAARRDTAPEAEVSALAAVYKFALARKEVAPQQSRPDDGTESKEDSADDHYTGT
jgi:hypothetical protein